MINVERVVSVWNKGDDSFIKDINVDNINLENLRMIFNPSADDSDLINVYTIGQEEAFKLKLLTDIEFDFSQYAYSLECSAK